MRYLLLIVLLVNFSILAEPLVKVGISVPLTGQAANYGLDVRDSILFAIKDLGLEDQLSLFIEDDQCDSKRAVSVAKKFVEVDQVDVVIGYACSNTAIVTGPIYQQAQIPVIVTCASSPNVTKSADVIFRTNPSDAMAAQYLAKYLVTQKYKNIASLNYQSDYAQDFKKSLEDELQAQNVSMSGIDYNPEQTDFRVLFLKLKQNQPEAIFLNPQAEGDLLLMLKQMKQLNWQLPVYSAYHAGGEKFRAEAGPLADGLRYVDIVDVERLLNKRGRQELNRYRKSGYQVRVLTSMIVTGYEAVRLLSESLKDQKEILSYLREPRVYQGLFGEYSFDPEGDILGLGFSMYQINNSQIKVISND